MPAFSSLLLTCASSRCEKKEAPLIQQLQLERLDEFLAPLQWGIHSRRFKWGWDLVHWREIQTNVLNRYIARHQSRTSPGTQKADPTL